jgi:hypothetical protein
VNAVIALTLGLVAIGLLVLISPLIALAAIRRRLLGRWLRARWEATHGKFGRRVLLVYSSSPNWQEYVEEDLLRRLDPHVVTLNWSDRQVPQPQSASGMEGLSTLDAAERIQPSGNCASSRRQSGGDLVLEAFPRSPARQGRTTPRGRGTVVRRSGQIRFGQ